jgi:hypothetical protein
MRKDSEEHTQTSQGDGSAWIGAGFNGPAHKQDGPSEQVEPRPCAHIGMRGKLPFDANATAALHDTADQQGLKGSDPLTASVLRDVPVHVVRPTPKPSPGDRRAQQLQNDPTRRELVNQLESADMGLDVKCNTRLKLFQIQWGL